MSLSRLCLVCYLRFAEGGRQVTYVRNILLVRIWQNIPSLASNADRQPPPGEGPRGSDCSCCSSSYSHKTLFKGVNAAEDTYLTYGWLGSGAFIPLLALNTCPDSRPHTQAQPLQSAVCLFLLLLLFFSLLDPIVVVPLVPSCPANSFRRIPTSSSIKRGLHHQLPLPF